MLIIHSDVSGKTQNTQDTLCVTRQQCSKRVAIRYFVTRKNAQKPEPSPHLLHKHRENIFYSRKRKQNI